nr:nuclear pore complex protein NUP98B-like isoform X4 [Solanum lycopersicum]
MQPNSFFFSIYIPPFHYIDNQQSSLLLRLMSIFFGNTASNFNAATNATSGQTQNSSTNSSTSPTFGKKYDFNSVANEPLVGSRDVNVSDSSIFGYPRAPAFGVSSNSHFGTARLDSYSFGQPAVSMSGSKGEESTPPFFMSSGFGKSTFGINQKGSRIASYIATPENDITGFSGGKIQSICGMQAYKDKSQEELRFEDYQLGDKGTLAFNAATNATSGQTQLIFPGSSFSQTFGKKYDVNSMTNEPLFWSRDANASGFSKFGSLQATSFGVSSNSHFGTPSFNSYSFGQPAISMSGIKGKESTTPLLQNSGFGKSAFGINQKGSRTTSYIATPDIDSTCLFGGRIQSICGMQTYQDKSQEELRFEDYQLGDKGQECGSSFSVSTAQGFGLINNTRPFISPALNQSTVDQPFYSHFPSTFTVERAGVDSLSKNSTSLAQQAISHIFPPNPSLLNSCGTRNRVQSTASDVSFSPWNNSNQFAPFKPASSSSTAFTTPLRNPFSLSTSAPLSPCSVSPSTYPLLTKPSGHDFYQKNSFSTTPVLTTGGASQSTLCLNCLKQSQPTPPGLSNVSSTPLAANQNTPLFIGPLQPEITPKVGTTLPTTNASHPTTEGASCSEIGQGVGQQPSMNGQQSYFPVIMEVKPSPNMPPAETQPSDQISVEHPYLVTSIQYGISSLPVSDNPAPVRRRSSLIIRHSSLTHHRLPPQKYKPTSDKPKVPFFMDKENATGVLKTEVIIIPRENPRDWVRPTTESPQGADTSMDRMHDGDKVLHKLKLQSEETHHDNCGDDEDVDGIMPKLQRADYYTVPPIEELLLKEKEEAGFCCHVKDFVVGRHGYGSIKFLGETDIRKLDLDSAVHFNHREVIIYMDESKKPPVGQGLNKPAEITLLNVKCINKSSGKEYRDGPMVNKYKDMLIKKAVEQHAEFVSYDPVEGQWKFRVSHF